MDLRQIDCFNKQIKIWKLLAIWPSNYTSYNFNFIYPLIFLSFFVGLYNSLYSINFYFLPRQLVVFAGELVLYFTNVSVISKVLTFVCFRKKIRKILETLESDMFNPDDEESANIIKKAKMFTIRFWKVVAVVSVTSNTAHVFVPLILHLCFGLPLDLPVCSYSFLSDDTKQRFIYALCLYQGIGMHFHMHYNLNTDSFLMGLMILTIAQLRVLDAKLRNVTCYRETAKTAGVGQRQSSEREANLELALKNCVIHYGEISK